MNLFSCINLQKALTKNCIVNKEQGKKRLSIYLSDFASYLELDGHTYLPFSVF